MERGPGGVYLPCPVKVSKSSKRVRMWRENVDIATFAHMVVCNHDTSLICKNTKGVFNFMSFAIFISQVVRCRQVGLVKKVQSWKSQKLSQPKVLFWYTPTPSMTFLVLVLIMRVIPWTQLKLFYLLLLLGNLFCEELLKTVRNSAKYNLAKFSWPFPMALYITLKILRGTNENWHFWQVHG